MRTSQLGGCACQQQRGLSGCCGSFSWCSLPSAVARSVWGHRGDWAQTCESARGQWGWPCTQTAHRYLQLLRPPWAFSWSTLSHGTKRFRSHHVGPRDLSPGLHHLSCKTGKLCHFLILNTYGTKRLFGVRRVVRGLFFGGRGRQGVAGV